MPILAVGLSKVAGVHHLPSSQVAQATSLVATCLASKSQPIRAAGLHASFFLLQSRHQSLVKPFFDRLFADKLVLQVQQTAMRPTCHAVMNYAAAFYVLENYAGTNDANTQQFLTQAIVSFFQSAPSDESENAELYDFVCRGVERLILTDCVQAPLVVNQIIVGVQNHLPALQDAKRWIAAIGLLVTCLYRLGAVARKSGSVSSSGVVNVGDQQQDASRFANLERVSAFTEKARASAIDPSRQLQPGMRN